MAKDQQISREEAKRLLDDLVAAHKDLSSQFRSLNKLVGMSCESEFGQAVYRPLELLIRCVSLILGDNIECVEWFVWCNECGASGLEHSLPDGSMRAVRSVDDLLDVLGFSG